MFQTSKGTLSAADLTAELNYSCYRFNRADRGMSAADLLKLFPDTGDAMERRFLAELNKVAA